MPNTNDWYCDQCDEIKPPEKVNYEEECADCGSDVISVTDLIGGYIGEIEEYVNEAQCALNGLRGFFEKHIRGEADAE